MSDQYASVFHEWEGLGRLSNNAFQLHGMAIIESVRVGSPGWIDDERLSSLVTNSIQGAVELEAAGVWGRDGEGYRVRDEAVIGRAVAFRDQLDQRADLCDLRGYHVRSSHEPVCADCRLPVEVE